MSWENFYLVCFVTGFCFSVLSLLGGAFHWPFGHGSQGWHFGTHAGSHFGTHGGGAAHPAAHAGGDGVSPFNLATAMAFLAWFGGIGYLLSGRGHLGELFVLGAALVAGIAGSAVVFVFLTKVLLKHEKFLESADFEMAGVLGRVTVGIREGGGTGEIVYSQAGTRRSAGARSENGRAIARGSEVVVTRYDRGIAYVRPWEEMAGAAAESAPGEENG